MAQFNLFRHHVRDADGVLVPVIKAFIVVPEDEAPLAPEDCTAFREWLNSSDPDRQAMAFEGDHEVRWFA